MGEAPGAPRACRCAGGPRRPRACTCAPSAAAFSRPPPMWSGCPWVHTIRVTSPTVRPIPSTWRRRSGPDPWRPASMSVISSSTTRYALAPSRRTECRPGTISISGERTRPLGGDGPPEQVRDAEDQQHDDRLTEAPRADAAAQLDAGDEPDEGRDEAEDPEREQLGSEQAVRQE